MKNLDIRLLLSIIETLLYILKSANPLNDHGEYDHRLQEYLESFKEDLKEMKNILTERLED